MLVTSVKVLFMLSAARGGHERRAVRSRPAPGICVSGNIVATEDHVMPTSPAPHGETVSHPWGLRDFRVLDQEDNQLTFGQPLW
jgi:hypothetical protein